MQTILVLFQLVYAMWSVIKQMSDIIWVVCNKLITVWAPTKKYSWAGSFFGTYGVTKYSSGWRKDVVN